MADSPNQRTPPPILDSKAKNLLITRPDNPSCACKHVSSKTKLPPINEEHKKRAPPSGLLNNYGNVTWPESGVRIGHYRNMNRSMNEEILTEALNKYARITEKKNSGMRSKSPQPWSNKNFSVIPLSTTRSGTTSPLSPVSDQLPQSSTASTASTVKSRKGRGHHSAYTVSTPEEPIVDRRLSRINRPRPWVQGSKNQPFRCRSPGSGVRTSKDKQIEVHYEHFLPKGKWIRFRPMVYAQNHKYGLKYEVRENSKLPRLTGQPPRSYVFDNDFNVWLFEKKLGREIEQEKEMGSRMKIYERHIMPKGRTPHTRAHKDIVESYHCHEINRLERREAVHIIQKWVRGWLVRKRLKKLKRETLLWHNKSWQGFVDDYKKLCGRVQQRYGIPKTCVPFEFQDVEEHLRAKRKYEDVFDKLQENGKLPREMLHMFFNRCDLFPSDSEIATAFDVVFRGCGSQADIIFLLDLSASVGEHNFRVQKDFIKSVATRLKLGKDHVRIGVIPYNDDVIDPVILGRYDTKETLFDAIDKIRFIRGLTHTHLAIEHMRATFKDHGRKDVQKIGVVMTDGRSYYEHHTQKQAEKAKLEGCKLYAVGVGNVANREELYRIATDPTYISSVYDTHVIEKIKTEVARSSCLKNCSLCHYVTPEECTNRGRGLFKKEVMEILWTIYVPKATGLKDIRRSTWVRPLVHDEEAAKWLGLVKNMESEDFRTCLRYVIKCKLEREGGLNVLSPTALGGVDRITDWDAAVRSVEDYMGYLDEKKELSRIETNYMKRRFLERKLLKDRGDQTE